MFQHRIRRRRYVSLIHVGLSGASLALLAVVPAHAATVDYATTATFSCSGCVITNNGSGDVQVVYGKGANTATLEFVGSQPGTSVENDGTFVTAGFGYIQASSTGTGSAINGTFILSINQSSPHQSWLTRAFPAATLSGTVANSKSTSYATFGSSPDPEVTLGGPVTYELDTSRKFNTDTYGYTIVSPSTGHGRTSLQGNISATPEPTLLTLTAAGFLGLVGIASRRRRKIS